MNGTGWLTVGAEWLISGAVLIVVWLVRLEGRVNMNAKTIADRALVRDRELQDARAQRQEDRETMRYIRQRLDSIQNHVTNCPVILDNQHTLMRVFKEHIDDDSKD